MARKPMNKGKITCKDVRRVKNGIEKCLRLYMNKEEAAQRLSNQLNIEPCFTNLVWKILEQENKEFFQSYYASFAWKQMVLISSASSSASLPSSDGFHNPAILSQPNSTIDLTSSLPNSHNLYNPAVFPQPSFNFEGSHNPQVLSQPNIIFVKPDDIDVLLPNTNFDESYDLDPLQANTNFDGSHNLQVLLQANTSFDDSHNLQLLSQQPNIKSGVSHNNLHVSSQPTFKFDESHNNLGVLSQPNCNVGLTEVASLGSHKPAGLSQLNSNAAHVPSIPYFCTTEQNQAGLTSTDVQQPHYSTSNDVFNNDGMSLQTTMHGGVNEVSAHSNGNWNNGN